MKWLSLHRPRARLRNGDLTQGQQYDPWLRHIENAYVLGWVALGAGIVVALTGSFWLSVWGNDEYRLTPEALSMPVRRLLEVMSSSWIAVVMLAFPLFYRSLRRFAENQKGPLGHTEMDVRQGERPVGGAVREDVADDAGSSPTGQAGT